MAPEKNRDLFQQMLIIGLKLENTVRSNEKNIMAEISGYGLGLVLP